MNNLERKVNLLVTWATSEDEASRKKAVEALKELSCELSPVVDSSSLDKDTLVRNITIELLKELGVPCNLTGYDYTIAAIRILVSDLRYYSSRMTSGVYRTVAFECDAADIRVERCIRHAIEFAWNNGDTDVFYKYFGNSVSRNKGKPTNSHFLVTLARVIIDRVGELKGGTE